MSETRTQTWAVTMRWRRSAASGCGAGKRLTHHHRRCATSSSEFHRSLHGLWHLVARDRLKAESRKKRGRRLRQEEDTGDARTFGDADSRIDELSANAVRAKFRGDGE